MIEDDQGQHPADRQDAEVAALARVRGYARNLAGLVLAMGILAAMAGVALVINQLTQPGGAVSVTVPDATVLDADVSPDGLPDGASLDIAGSLDDVALQVHELPVLHRALTELPMLISGALVLVAGVLLRRVLLEIAAGRPFAPVVPGRLAGLAVTIVALAFLPQAADTLATVTVLQHIGAAGGDSPVGFTILSVDLVPLAVAAAIGIGASVFRHGQRLTEDVDGLV